MSAQVAIHDLHKSFGEQIVLDGVNLTVNEGETVAVLGRSGEGKSVLLKLIVGLEGPNSGSIEVFGKDITELPKRELNEVRKKIGFLFQQAALYDPLSVEENVAFPLRRHTALSEAETKQKVLDLLAGVGMDGDAGKMPAEISGGMQKRVGLARALALDPAVLLFDEPTAGLDPITAAEIAALIARLKSERKTTGIVVTHDLHSARIFADRFVLLHEGSVVADGSLDDLMKSREPFVRRFMDSQNMASQNMEECG